MYIMSQGNPSPRKRGSSAELSFDDQGKMLRHLQGTSKQQQELIKEVQEEIELMKQEFQENIQKLKQEYERLKERKHFDEGKICKKCRILLE